MATPELLCVRALQPKKPENPSVVCILYVFRVPIGMFGKEKNSLIVSTTLKLGYVAAIYA